MNNQTLSDADIYRIANRWCPTAAESKQGIKLAIVSALREAAGTCNAVLEAAQKDAWAFEHLGKPVIAAAIHYPDCWDTAAYPTLAHALTELYVWFKCASENCAKRQAAPETLGREALATELIQLVAELPNRTSPEDDPEAMLADADELRNCLFNALENLGLRIVPAAQSGERAGVAEGWKWVPLVPTTPMMHAITGQQATARERYRDVLAAAPTQQETQTNDVNS
ncbi:hypothetical protein [Ralstonia pseudosolanacearum]|uniref:hypothetical protein n=1 Tax=Ralstonia pseudosolanacearum TaxID=1310165 RepID=UPI0008D9B38C|nr:hypothetical protein [Ralstonia pseudosolanacearum]MCL1618358.1 hypothetical protein [Ralstonia pseudosolanacearum CaRs-Mep]